MLSAVVLLPIIRRYMQSHGQTEVKLHDLPAASALAELADGTADMAIMVLDGHHPEFKFESLTIEECAVVTPLKHPLLAKKEVLFEDIVKYPLLIPDFYRALRDVFAAEDWRAITTLSRWRGIWLVLHGWMVVALAAFGGAAAWDYHWLAGLLVTPLALAILGGRQLGLSILMHDGAHGLLHPNRKTNNWLGQWPSARACRETGPRGTGPRNGSSGTPGHRAAVRGRRQSARSRCRWRPC